MGNTAQESSLESSLSNLAKRRGGFGGERGAVASATAAGVRGCRVGHEELGCTGRRDDYSR